MKFNGKKSGPIPNKEVFEFIYQELKIQKMSSILIAQVHDELIFEIAPGELMEMQSIVVTLMKSAMNLKIPLEVEIKTGPTWGDME